MKRSGKWKELRDRFLKNKKCAVCGNAKKLEAHHIIPFSMDPSHELDEKNLIALCEGKKIVNCHLVFGHGGCYDDYNPFVKRTARFMAWLFKCRQKIKVKG